MKRALELAFLELGYTGSQIDIRVASIIKKISQDEFLEFVKDRKFTHPETKNQVLFQSLPSDLQSKLREHYKMKMSEKRQPEEKVSQDLYKKDKEGREFVENDDVREKKISGMEAKVKEESFLKSTAKSLTNYDDFKSFAKAVKKKDSKAMKKALPGMAKGLLKTSLAIGGVVAAGAFGPGIVGPVVKAHLSATAVKGALLTMGGSAKGFLAKTGNMLISSLTAGYVSKMSQKIQKTVDEKVIKKEESGNIKRGAKKDEDEDLANALAKEIQKHYLKELANLKDKKNIDKVMSMYIKD